MLPKKKAKLALVATTDSSFILKTTEEGSARSLRFQPFSSERDPMGQSFIQWHYLYLGVILDRMADVTLILSRIENGDPEAADQLLPLVYDELRNTAGQDGGGVYNMGTGTLTVAESAFVANRAEGHGGGIFNDAGDVSILRSRFLANQVGSDNKLGTAIYSTAGGSLDIDDETYFTPNGVPVFVEE